MILGQWQQDLDFLFPSKCLILGYFFLLFSFGESRVWTYPGMTLFDIGKKVITSDAFIFPSSCNTHFIYSFALTEQKIKEE